MKAIHNAHYGPISALRLTDRPPPELRARDVLVRVHAAGLHVGDCFGVQGAPMAMRLVTGLLRPTVGIPGFDVAGRVEAVGPAVTRLRVGDEVFGKTHGACAELTRADEHTLARKPPSLDFTQAAALPTSATAALHALHTAAKIEPGMSVLIVGAAGGVGTFAVQIARHLGARVTGVCSTANIDLVRSLGADEVIDYTRDDFTRTGPRHHVILDNIEDRSLAEVRRALTPDGTLLLNSGTGATGLRMLRRLVAPLALSPFVRHTLRRFVSAADHTSLTHLAQLAESGAVRPVVDRTYPLSETPAALAHIATGHARGKVVVTV